MTGRDGTGRDKRTDKQTDIGTDRLFSENIILDISFLEVINSKKMNIVYAKEVLASQVHPRCAKIHNFLGPTYGEVMKH